ncbi:uncharacterized protein LOC130263910 [Oenanthe melanoleuca]|uniref:uncharacterized protein LOC130263910 n=1 Tax=Oenanthe melanoleuca TaxID=2939378 RepID=UPI0024C1279C|nr:uncharacterized protein LOC130263910 [Oenanthe melanoleuca]
MRRCRGAGLAALAALLLVASGRAQVQQEPFLETTEGTGIAINCSHPSKRSGDYIHFYRHLPGQSPEFLIYTTGTSKDVPAMAGKLWVSEDGRWSALWLGRPRRGDAAVYYCALGHGQRSRGCGRLQLRVPARARPLCSARLRQLRSWRQRTAPPGHGSVRADTVCLRHRRQHGPSQTISSSFRKNSVPSLERGILLPVYKGSDRCPAPTALLPPHPARSRREPERHRRRAEPRGGAGGGGGQSEGEKRRWRSREPGLRGQRGSAGAMRRCRGAGLAALGAVLLAVAADTDRVQQKPWAETTEGTGLNLTCLHPEIAADSTQWYRKFPDQAPQLVAMAVRGTKPVLEPEGTLWVSADRCWSALWLGRPRRGDAAVYYCALGHGQRSRGCGRRRRTALIWGGAGGGGEKRRELEWSIGRGGGRAAAESRG